ncbi:protein of unknown function DUF4484 [Metschnikowia aff. pulcherrima]|uniref:DUF4484 domain-containing protein n=1 Tax=Metschnikowia aff. pulcherrima TaxID=2163413 RepID=A0A4P6XL47_9ASCO|nr:protein of unknown function DUF4484 [Metschnikowia aff. pulcherrima]
MSLASSETAVNALPPRVVYMFLAKFDAKEGYKMAWSSHKGPEYEGLECKALPSGVHEYAATNIYLAHECHDRLYYGTARFRQQNLNPEGGLDRELVKMYSLGILVEPLKGEHWKPHEFSAMGWEHLGSLDAALQQYMNTGDMASISLLYLALSGAALLPEVSRSAAVSNADHPLCKLPLILLTVGPLIFPLFKAALLRKNILIFNHSSQGTAKLVQETCLRGPAACGALAYISSLISVIPRNVQFDFLSRDSDTSMLFSRPLYTVGLQDMGTNFLAHYPGFIANTSDEILKYQKQLYDYAVVMPSSDYDTCQVFSSSNLSEPVKATYNDYGKFLKVYRNLPQNTDARRLSMADDQASIGTLSSIFSAIRNAYFGEGKENKLYSEPAWWFSAATSPMSWREYIWLAFAWFASAGTTEREAGKADLDGEESAEGNSLRSELLQLTSIVGQFHKLTKKWFFIIEEIISETMPADAHPNEKFTLELTPQDIVDMELDPYSQQDLTFVREFVLEYWGSTIDEVEIGLGLHNFFC